MFSLFEYCLSQYTHTTHIDGMIGQKTTIVNQEKIPTAVIMAVTVIPLMPLIPVV